MKLGAQFPTFWGTRADLQKGSHVSWACCRAKGKWHRPSALSLQSQLWPVHDTCRRMWGSRDASRPGSGAHKIAARVRKPCLSEVGGLRSHLSGHGCCVPRGERVQRSASPLLTHSPQCSRGSSVNHTRLRCPAASLSLCWKSHRLTELGHFDDS